jgi:hypothetical protein
MTAVVIALLVGGAMYSGTASADAPIFGCIGLTPGAHDHGSVRVNGAADTHSSLSSHASLDGCVDTWTVWPALNASYDHSQVTPRGLSLSLHHGHADCTGPSEWATARVNVDLGPSLVPGHLLRVKADGIATITGDLGAPGGAALHFVGIDEYSTTGSPKTGAGGTLELNADVTLTGPCVLDAHPAIQTQLTNIVLQVTPID